MTTAVIDPPRPLPLAADIERLITVGDVATQVSYAQDDSTVQATLVSNASTRRQSVSGVSTDEELIDVIQHQHSYQAAARLVSVVDEMTQTLVDLGR